MHGDNAFADNQTYNESKKCTVILNVDTQTAGQSQEYLYTQKGLGRDANPARNYNKFYTHAHNEKNVQITKN